MKKILLGLLVVLTTLGAYGQNNSHNLITHSSSSQTMVWSDTEKEYMFFDLEKSHPDYCSWMIIYNDNHTGSVKMTNIASDVVYNIIIYNYEILQDDEGMDYIWMDCIQQHNSQKLTITLNSYTNGKFISVFMPDSQLALFFSSLKD